MSAVLADLVLIVHFAFVSFVVGGFALIWIGAALSWRWVRNFWFRLAHLGAIGYVAVTSVIGVPCPLTVWEDALRRSTAERAFIARWIHRILFYDFPEWGFTTAYVLFALIVIATMWWVRPALPRRTRG